MKELSKEEKAKAYDEVLEKLKKYEGSPTLWSYDDMCEKFFPKLKESEDERIRKALIEWFKVMNDGNYEECTFINYNIPVTAIIAWLEKQDYTFEIKEGHWYKCVCDYMLDSSNLMFKNGRLYYCRSDWRLSGEIDERNVKDIGVNGYKSFFRPATNQEIKDWLEKQDKPAWNKEDEEIIRSIFLGIEAYSPSIIYGNGKEKVLNWIKSLKDRYTWKPSEEQMEALHAKLSYINGERELVPDVTLESLYNDLKKLKG